MAVPVQPLVYFMRPVGADGPVKIGCSTDPEGRLKTYCGWSPIPLEVVATIPGKWAVEWAFHAKFAHLRSHHEWFTADAELTAVIEAVRAGTFDLATLPEPRRLQTPAQREAWTRKKPRLAKAA